MFFFITTYLLPHNSETNYHSFDIWDAICNSLYSPIIHKSVLSWPNNFQQYEFQTTYFELLSIIYLSIGSNSFLNGFFVKYYADVA